MATKKTTEQFIAEARAIHGNRYDYSKTIYTTNKSKIIVIDLINDEEFEVEARVHLQYSGRPRGVSGMLSRSCSLCGKMMSTPSKKDLSGFIAHGEQEHPNYFLGSAPSYAWIEKKYFNPINNTWYGSRKYLARSITELGWTNEQYYRTYGEQYMPEEWYQNTHDPKFGDAPNQPFCLETGEPVPFDAGHWCYPIFKDFSASTSWHAKNTDRVARSEETKKRKQEEDPNFMLRPSQLQYWMKKHGMSRHEAIVERRKRQQTFSLEKCIEKYGEEDGLKFWEERQQKWIQTRKDNGSFGPTSEIANEFVAKLSIPFPDIKSERLIRLDNKFVRPDLVRMNNRRIIEFFGDYWHCNPEVYTADDIVKRSSRKEGIKVHEIWEKDVARIELLERHDYKVLIVWEKDYKERHDEVLMECIKHLM